MRGRVRRLARAPRRVRPEGSVITVDRRRFVERLGAWAGFSLAGAPPELCELVFAAGRTLLRAQIAGPVKNPRQLFLALLAVLIRRRLRTLKQ